MNTSAPPGGIKPPARPNGAVATPPSNAAPNLCPSGASSAAVPAPSMAAAVVPRTTPDAICAPVVAPLAVNNGNSPGTAAVDATAPATFATPEDTGIVRSVSFIAAAVISSGCIPICAIASPPGVLAAATSVIAPTTFGPITGMLFNACMASILTGFLRLRSRPRTFSTSPLTRRSKMRSCSSAFFSRLSVCKSAGSVPLPVLRRSTSPGTGCRVIAFLRSSSVPIRLRYSSALR